MIPQDGDRRQEDSLRDWLRFVVWRSDGEKKVALDPSTGHDADDKSPEIWLDYEEARRAKLRIQRAVGIGFALDETPFALVDLDRCFGDEEITPFASTVMHELHGVEEESVSGEGMHILVRGEKPGTRCADKQPGREIEIYDRQRFVAIADESIVEKPIPNRQEALTALYERVFPQQTIDDVLEDADSEEPAPSWDVEPEDFELLDRARKDRQTGKAFAKLHDHGDWSGYPSRSEAHFDLCRLLAFWTVKDSGRIEHMFWSSALAATVERPNPGAYMRRTIGNAIKRQKRTFNPGVDSTKKEEVKRLATRHVEWIGSFEWSHEGGETDKAVYIQITHHAGEWAYLTEDGALEFNVSQQVIADSMGVSQRLVSKSLSRLREGALITRTSKGHSGRNSYYMLHPEELPPF